MLELEVFICEFLAIDGLATSAIVVREVSSLTHEVGDDPMEGTSLVSVSLLSSAESSEIFRCLRHYVISELQK